MPTAEGIFPDPGWQTVSPQDAGLDPAALSAAADLLSRPHSNARAFLAARGGRIACERYYQGCAPADRLHLFSVTKSVMSALTGIALGEGALKSLEQRVVDFFPEVPAASAGPLGLLTLRHLLTMTTGMAWPGGRMGREPMFQRLVHSPDWARFILSVPVRREQVGVFHYNSAASHLLSLILPRATGQPACEYAAARLFAPLGIAPVVHGVDWDADPQGSSIGGWGLHLNARELARFGLL
jgi:CubicO group peptidase (beta-lactamase class C family)